MNRTLKRPMFRIGGSAGTGITSGLDQPRKQYAQGSEDRFMELVSKLREQGFTQQEAIEEARRRLDMAKGGRAGYTQRVLGSVFLPVPGSVQDSNMWIGVQIKWIQQSLLLLMLSLKMFRKEVVQ